MSVLVIEARYRSKSCLSVLIVESSSVWVRVIASWSMEMLMWRVWGLLAPSAITVRLGFVILERILWVLFCWCFLDVWWITAVCVPSVSGLMKDTCQWSVRNVTERCGSTEVECTCVTTAISGSVKMIILSMRQCVKLLKATQISAFPVAREVRYAIDLWKEGWMC